MSLHLMKASEFHLVTMVIVVWRLLKVVGQQVVRFGQIRLTDNSLQKKEHKRTFPDVFQKLLLFFSHVISELYGNLLSSPLSPQDIWDSELRLHTKR